LREDAVTRASLLSYLLTFSVVLGLVAACGARTGSELFDGIGGSAGGEEAGASDGTILDSFVGCHAPVDCAHPEVSAPDVTMTSDVSSDAPVTCTQLGRNAFNNGPNCSMSTVEKCSDGNKYEASCSCQAGKCFCSITTGSQGTDTTISFMPPGCPSSCTISPSEALKECGYPF
jgi:hypothetical protein